MNKYINLTLDNIDKEHICCAIGDPKHQCGVNNKKEWIKGKLKDGHVFRKLNTRGKIFIGDQKFFEYYGVKIVDTVGDYEL